MRSRGELDGRLQAHASVGGAPTSAMRGYVLSELEARGPLRSIELEDRTVEHWLSTGWTNQRNVSRCPGRDERGRRGPGPRREGGQRLWDLAERCLPDDRPPGGLAPARGGRAGRSERSLRALGVARPPHIREHFTRWRYPDLRGVLAELVAEGRVLEVSVGDPPGPWYLHAEDEPLLQLRCARRRLARAHDAALPLRQPDLRPRAHQNSSGTSISASRSTRRVAKRRYGFFVMPVLSGDRFIARVDPAMDRRAGSAGHQRRAPRVARGRLGGRARPAGRDPPASPRGWARRRRGARGARGVAARAGGVTGCGGAATGLCSARHGTAPRRRDGSRARPAGRARRRALARHRPRLRPADGARAAPVPDRAAARRAGRPRRGRSARSSTTRRCSSTSAATPTPTSRRSGSATTSR